MGFARAMVIAGALFMGAVMMGVVPASLPHPACHHHVHPWSVHEQPGKLEGMWAPNTALQSVRRVLNGKIPSSESVAISPRGEKIFLGDKFGGIYAGAILKDGDRVDIQLESEKPIVKVPGRPLGIHAVSENRLLVCDVIEGLLDVNLKNGSYEVLAYRARSHARSGRTSKIVYANDLDVGEDGTVYFTDSTDIPVDKCSEGYYSTLRTYLLNLMEGRPTGRLLAFNPQTNITKELMSKLWYANGVAVAKDGSFVAVVETNAFRVHRYWLQEPYAKTRDILISNLPGFPDGISVAPDGNFWIALVAPSLPSWNLLRFKFPRLAYAWISEYISLPIQKWGYVVKVSPQGKVLNVLADVQGGFISGISSVTEHDGHLFLGNLIGDYISVFDLKLLQQFTDKPVLDKQEL